MPIFAFPRLRVPWYRCVTRKKFKFHLSKSWWK